MRLFIGIKLDDIAIKKVNNYYKYFYSEKVKGNFTDLSNLHLTLSFLGEINSEKIDDIIKVIDSLQSNIKSFKIVKLTRLKDMLIGEVFKDSYLSCLHSELIEKLKQLGLKISDKDFYPHITLIRQVEGLRDLKIIDSNIEITSNVNKITLFESTRINGILRYIPLN